MNSYSKGGGKNSKPPEQQGEPSPGPHARTKDAAVWDGTESKLVPDGLESFQEPHTGIQFSYVLTEREVYECLRKSGLSCRNARWYAAVPAVLGVLLAVLAAAGLILQNRIFLFCAVPIPVLIALAVLLPARADKKRAREWSDGRRIRMRVYPDRILAACGSRRWDVPLDGSSEYARIGNLIALFVNGAEARDPDAEKVIVLPLRCVHPTAIADLQAMIMAGTRPRCSSRK